MSVVTSKQGPLKSVLKRKLWIRAEMRCRGAWKEAWVQTEAQNGANVADKRLEGSRHAILVVRQRVCLKKLRKLRSKTA
jgi:hypothetical protein